jgi:hypothetical protein
MSPEQLGMTSTMIFVEVIGLNGIGRYTALLLLVASETQQGNKADGSAFKHQRYPLENEQLPLTHLPNKIDKVNLAVNQMEYSLDLVWSRTCTPPED